jgi:hypothetical protein
MIAKCNCTHPAQDDIHGPGNRVFNPLKAGKSVVGGYGHRCTVCRSTRYTSKPQ